MFGQPTLITAGTYSMQFNDSSLVCNATTTLTLLVAATYPGRHIYIKSGGAFTITSASSNVTCTTGQTAIIGGAGAANWVLLQSDGKNWITVMGA